MSSIINVNALSLVIVSISFILLLGPTSMTMNVFATTNTANQGIGQSQNAVQLVSVYRVTAPFFRVITQTHKVKLILETMHQHNKVVVAVVAIQPIKE